MKITVNNTQLYFDVEGTGLNPVGPKMQQKPTLILLHGGPGSDHSGFKPHFSELTDVAQIIYLDHRGCGRSDVSEEQHWNLNNWADDIFHFCQALNIQQPIILGQSFGGFVAINYAARYPQHISKLILASTLARINIENAFAKFHELGGERAVDVAKRLWSEAHLENSIEFNEVCVPLYSVAPPNLDIMQRVSFNETIYLHFLANEFKTMDQRPLLKQIECPCLVMTGVDDPITTLDDGKDMLNYLPTGKTQFHDIENARHTLFRDQPAQAFQIVRDFIKQSD